MSCFNPYFNGYSTLTGESINLKYFIGLCFNPYFNGYSTLTRFKQVGWFYIKPVSILILMDTLL